MSNDTIDLSNIEELLAKARGQDVSRVQLKPADALANTITQFIGAFNVTESNLHVPMKLVYDKYVVWVLENDLPPETYRNFNQKFSSKFSRVRMAGSNCFKINPESMGLPSYYRADKDERFLKERKHSQKRHYDLIGVRKFAGSYIVRIELETGLHYLGQFQKLDDATFYYDINAVYHYGKHAIINKKDKRSLYDKILKETKKPVFKTKIPRS